MGNCCNGKDDAQEEKVNIIQDPENKPSRHITSSQARSSYLREKLKAREENQPLLRPEAKKTDHGAIPDPRQAAKVRGEKLGEAEMASDRMKTAAQRWNHTAAALKKT